MLKGVLLGFACYAAYAISDAFVKSLHGGLPAFEAVFFGAVLMLSALPLIRRPGDRWIEVFQARKPSLWWIRAVSGAVCNITAVIAFTALPMASAYGGVHGAIAASAAYLHRLNTGRGAHVEVPLQDALLSI